MCSHGNNYECLECMKANSYYPSLTRYSHLSDNFDESLYINRFVTNPSKPIAKYIQPGEEPYIIIAPGKYVGKVLAFNSKKNWLKLTDGNWIVFDKSHTYTPSKENITDKDIPDDVKLQLAANVLAFTGRAPASATKAVVNTVTGVADTADTLMNITGFIGENLKWILIVIVIILVISMLNKLT